MPNKINIQVNAFTTVENIVRKINEAIAGNNVAGVFYNKINILQGDIEIVLDKNTNIVEIPVRHAKGAGTSQYRGVYWVKKEGKWRVQLSHKGKRYTVGRFTDEIEAAKAYDKKVFELLGGDAFLNFPIEKDDSLKVGDLVEFAFRRGGKNTAQGKILEVELNCEEGLPYMVDGPYGCFWYAEKELRKVCD